ncbi:MAG: hypothetical protein KGM24_15310, partial [Elusimicrobia bacterium]|nr:hypothetical protein [Elusimicrobiota bacterium]
ERLAEALDGAARAPRERGSSMDQWGADDQWRLFFCDREARRNARAGLELRAPVLQVWHQDLECSYAGPRWEAGAPSFFTFPWLSRARARRDVRRGAERGGGREERGPRPIMTDLRDGDVIMGGEGKLAAALEAGLASGERVEAVVVESTCVPTVIGDDVPKALRALRDRIGVPLIYSSAAANQQVDVGRLLLERVRTEPGWGRGRTIPSSVNLIGFPEGAALDEMKTLLERAGVRVHVAAMPSLTLEQARALPRAAAQVFLPNAAYEPIYEAVFRTIPVPAHSFDAPYGAAGTRRWLRAVAGLFGREAAAERAAEEAFAPALPRWNELRREAAGRRLAFVVDRERLPRLTDPSRFWGVPVLRVLREFGLGVEVLLHGAKDRGPLKGFSTPDELSRLLSEGRFDAVYSEYFFDDRLVRAGKAQFSLGFFEPGLRGAVATLERLLASARWGFYRRYADAFRAEGA